MSIQSIVKAIDISQQCVHLGLRGPVDLAGRESSGMSPSSVRTLSVFSGGDDLILLKTGAGIKYKLRTLCVLMWVLGHFIQQKVIRGQMGNLGKT